MINHLSKDFELKNETSIFGIGDDCAVIDVGHHFQLLTTDMLIEGVHFDLTYTPLKHLGYKSVVVNLSDIYAMRFAKTDYCQYSLVKSFSFGSSRRAL